MGIGQSRQSRSCAIALSSNVPNFDLAEINEALAPQVLAVLKDVDITPSGSTSTAEAIALGHPIGCSGARIVVTLLSEMMRRQAGCGLATLCVSGGMGMAMAVERL